MSLVYAEAIAFIGRNKGLVIVICLTALAYFVGDTIVGVAAYMQPKVTINHVVIEKNISVDKTVTEERQIRRPDGTIEMLKLVHSDIRKMSLKDSRSSSESTPILPSGAKLTLLPGLAYAPVDKRWSASLGVELGAFQAGIMHEVVQMHPDQMRFPDGFRPVIWGAYRWGLGK